MKRFADLERSMQEKLSKDLAAAAPDVWPAIESRARGALADGAGGRPAGKKKRTAARRWAAVLAAAAVVVTAFAFAFARRPAMQASADTVYDTGGHLKNVGYSKPSVSFVAAYNGFSLSLLKRMTQSRSNTFLSPASVYLALGMTYNGAQGQTAAEFARVLNAGGEGIDGFDRDCAALQSLMAGSQRFSLANSIWLSRSFAQDIRGDFLERDRRSFGATVGLVDYSSAGAADTINRWVMRNTKNKIDPGFRQFDAGTVMTLINTVYFKSDWAHPFSADSTHKDGFQTPDGSKTVEYMSGRFTRYFEDDRLQGILLPYDDGRTSLMILLPKTDLKDLLGRLTAADLTAYAKNNGSNPTQALLTLPRVHFSYRASLGETLEAMGLQTAFDSRQADFGAMTKDGAPLCISDVTHMTDLAIDEKGTEAAAATAAAIVGSSGPAPQTVTKEMRVNRPFLAAIVNNDTGALLFIGTVNDPSAAQ